MTYFISLPKNNKRTKLFLSVSLGPLNHVVRNVALITIELVWIKFILSCILHKDYDITNQKDLNEMILSPDFGAYNRALAWAFEYAERNVDPPSGVLLGRDWNYGVRARAKNRDFFSYTSFGRFLKDILDTPDPHDFINNAKKYSRGNISETPQDFLFIEKNFVHNVLGINLSQFPVTNFLRNVLSHIKIEHFSTQRQEFVSFFIHEFLKEFRTTSKIESSGIVRDNMLQFYIYFVTEELKICDKKDLLNKLKRTEKELSSIFQQPSALKPSLSDEGYDAFFILKLIRENSPSHFYSLLIASYLMKQEPDYSFSTSHEYLNIHKKLKTKDFQNHVRDVIKSLSKYGEFKSNLDKEFLSFLVIWWEYYQFSFIGERLTRSIHRLLLGDNNPDEIHKIVDQRDIGIMLDFLKTYLSNSDEYVDALRKDKDFEKIQMQLEEICEFGKPTPDIIYDYLFGIASSRISEEPAGPPFFPSMDSFESWVDKLTNVLNLM